MTISWIFGHSRWTRSASPKPYLASLLRLQGLVNELALDLLHADGSKLPVIANAAEKRGPEGEHVFTRLTVFKATDRRACERGLVAGKVQAEAAASAEHEISVPAGTRTGAIHRQ